MKKEFLILGSLIVGITTTGCKSEKSEQGSTDQNSTSPDSQKTSIGNCTVANVDGGVQFTCGETTAFLAHGAKGDAGATGPQGTPGAQGAIGPQGPMGGFAGNGLAPRLFDGDGQIIGDYVLGMSIGNEAAPTFVSVWDSANDATATYEATGIISPRMPSLYYFASDCTGTPHLQGQYATATDPTPLPADRIFYFRGNAYKVTNQLSYFDYRSYLGSDGSCRLNTSAYFSSRMMKKVVPVTTTLPAKLKEGFSVKMR